MKYFLIIFSSTIDDGWSLSLVIPLIDYCDDEWGKRLQVYIIALNNREQYGLNTKELKEDDERGREGVSTETVQFPSFSFSLLYHPSYSVVNWIIPLISLVKYTLNCALNSALNLTQPILWSPITPTETLERRWSCCLWPTRSFKASRMSQGSL